MARLTGWRSLGAGWLCAFWALWAAAHPLPESRVWVDTTPDGLRLLLQLPLNRLEYGFGQALADEPATALTRHGDALARYLLLHVGARSGAQGWQALRPSLNLLGSDASAELEAVMELRAPPGADRRHFTLICDAIVHEVHTHQIQVFLRNDWTGGQVGEPPQPLGMLSHGRTSLPVSLSQAGSAVGNLWWAGVVHIAEGTDHLMFLLLLLVVAPLRVERVAAGTGTAARCWGRSRPLREALRHTAEVVTAFTLGHSCTLMLASTGVWAPPAQSVEVGVALTIAVAAWHAWRPWFVHGEAPMAGGLGLIHGFAFSASLSGAGLTPWQHAQALLAFNLGIETLQLLLLALVLPALLTLARRWPDHYARLRMGISLLGGGLAMLWCAQRL